ncbi:MAG: hypothetical protein GWM98_22415, partial [Nitrospinaceae bacterium]|nr:hypothetical protein [Nitrospinaceae bacterium]
MAKSYPDLGGAVTEKLGTEQNEEAANAPVLEAKSTGEVEGNPIPMEPVSLPASDINDGVTEADPSPLTPTPHEDKGPVPSNKENEREVDRQDDSSFGDWLKQKLTSFMSAIKTRDPGVNTQAGPAPKVQLEGTADPNNMQTQKQDSADQVKAQRDKTSEQLMNHPGQKNIKPKKVEKKQAVTLSTENPPPITTPEDPGMADYANASLPENIRNRADQMLQPGIAANTAQVKNQTVEAAQTKESDKQSAIEETQAKAKEANQKADTDQRNIVIENRKKVAAQQKAGIEDTYKKTNEFNKQSNDKQQENQRLIKDKTDTAQEQAKGELEKGEKDAEAEKKKKEAEAAAKKRELEKEQEKSSWWEKAGSFLKKAVKVITSAIDGIFNALRAAVATIIEKAKNAAIGLINKARDWIVNKINDFRDWAKKQVNKYLAETFPGLAAKINSAIDAVADVAVAGVNAVADTLIAGIEALAKELSEALDKILASFQAGLKAAVQIA